MFEDNIKKNKVASAAKSVTNRDDKEINLLPENLRRAKRKLVKSPAVDSFTYTKPGEVMRQQSAKTTSPASSILKEWWQRVRKALVRPVTPAGKKISLPLNSPARPLNKLYAQTPSTTKPSKKKTPKPQKKDENKASPIPAAITMSVKKPSAPLSKIPAAKKVSEKKNNSIDLFGVSDKPRKSFNWRHQTTSPTNVLAKIDSQLSKKQGQKDVKPKVPRDQFDVNLIPEELVVEVDLKKIGKSLLLASVLGILAVGVLYLGINFYHLRQQNNLAGARDKISKIEEAIDAKSDDLKILRGYQLTYNNIKRLLSAHIYWSDFFNFLERTVVQDVYYENVDADINGLISIKAKAKSYLAVAQQYKVFQEAPEVISVKIDRAYIDAAEQNDALEEDFKNVIMSDKNSSTTSSTLLTFEQQNDIILNTLQNSPVNFTVSLVIDPNIFNRNEQGENIISK